MSTCRENYGAKADVLQVTVDAEARGDLIWIIVRKNGRACGVAANVDNIGETEWVISISRNLPISTVNA